jgi:hypothetical protein
MPLDMVGIPPSISPSALTSPARSPSTWAPTCDAARHGRHPTIDFNIGADQSRSIAEHMGTRPVMPLDMVGTPRRAHGHRPVMPLDMFGIPPSISPLALASPARSPSTWAPTCDAASTSSPSPSSIAP